MRPFFFAYGGVDFVEQKLPMCRRSLAAVEFEEAKDDPRSI